MNMSGRKEPVKAGDMICISCFILFPDHYKQRLSSDMTGGRGKAATRLQVWMERLSLIRTTVIYLILLIDALTTAVANNSTTTLVHSLVSLRVSSHSLQK